jgi:2'-hydroxyisoflavone reductase
MTRRSFVSSLAALAMAGLPRRGAAAARSAEGKGKRLLLLGGTGFLGPAIVEAARARGHLLTLFNRGKTRPGLFPDVEQLRGDRDGKLDALRGRTWDAVIDTSGYVPRVVKMSAELLAPNVGQYVFISSISVYPDGTKPGADETAPLQTMADPTNEDVREHYGALKALCERAAEAAMPGRATIVRPGLIVGPGDPTDRFTYWPVRLDRGGDVLAPGDGDDPAQVVDVRDVAAFLVALVETRDHGTYNATGPKERTPMKAMLEAVRQGTSSRANLVWVPWPFLKARAVSPWTDLPVWIPSGEPESGISAVSNARAVAKGLAFRPVAETARETLAWWKTLPEDRRKLRAGMAAEKEKEILAAFRASLAAPKPKAG